MTGWIDGWIDGWKLQRRDVVTLFLTVFRAVLCLQRSHTHSFGFAPAPPSQDSSQQLPSWLTLLQPPSVTQSLDLTTRPG